MHKSYEYEFKLDSKIMLYILILDFSQLFSQLNSIQFSKSHAKPRGDWNPWFAISYSNACALNWTSRRWMKWLQWVRTTPMPCRYHQQFQELSWTWGIGFLHLYFFSWNLRFGDFCSVCSKSAQLFHSFETHHLCCNKLDYTPKATRVGWLVEFLEVVNHQNWSPML